MPLFLHCYNSSLPKLCLKWDGVVYFPLKALAGVSVVFLMYRKFNTLSAFASQ